MFHGGVGDRIGFQSNRALRELGVKQQSGTDPGTKINHGGFVRNVSLENLKCFGLPVDLAIEKVPPVIF